MHVFLCQISVHHTGPYVFTPEILTWLNYNNICTYFNHIQLAKTTDNEMNQILKTSED